MIGGPGAFIMIADETRSFADAVRAKMVLEIAGDESMVDKDIRDLAWR